MSWKVVFESEDFAIEKSTNGWWSIFFKHGNGKNRKSQRLKKDEAERMLSEIRTLDGLAYWWGW